MSLVLRDSRGGVLILSFNRPDRNNAWTIDMEEEYFDALSEATADPDVRVIVVTGAGKSFCPGMDMQVLAESGASDRPTTDRPRRPMTLARLVPKPVIAAVNGACAGIGVIQACAADIRFAARGAKMATSFTRRGLPAEHALAWMLPRMIGTGAAMDLLLSGRTIVAEEAHAMGLIEHLCEPDRVLADAVDYAIDMAESCSPRAMAAVKQQVWSDWERSSEQSRLASFTLVDALRSDLAEGSASFMEKRPPRFCGLAIPLTEERGLRSPAVS